MRERAHNKHAGMHAGSQAVVVYRASNTSLGPAPHHPPAPASPPNALAPYLKTLAQFVEAEVGAKVLKVLAAVDVAGGLAGGHPSISQRLHAHLGRLRHVTLGQEHLCRTKPSNQGRGGGKKGA